MTDGLIRIASSFDAAETMDRLEAEVRARGLTVFARIDHAQGAREAGLALRPTVVLVFGNARGGTPLMQANQEAGLDLPLKVLVYEDADGKSWLAHNDVRWLAARYGIAQVPHVAALVAVLEAVTVKAAQGGVRAE
jgi:uncharacterized protein (DUF302 family)